MASVEEVHCGWLVKSPPSKFVNLLRGKVPFPVKAKWRKRFFRLYKAAESYSYKFTYYQDDTLQKKYGSIILENCVGIQASLDSTCYQHLFALHTQSRKSNRVYYLAADTEQEMTNWVSKLCKLCDLEDSPAASEAPVRSPVIESKLGPAVTHAGSTSSPFNNRHSYKELSDCTSGFGERSSYNQSTSGDGSDDDGDYKVPPAPIHLSTSFGKASPTVKPRTLTGSQTRDSAVEEDYVNAGSLIEQMHLKAARDAPEEDSAPPRPPKRSESDEQEYANVPFGSPSHDERHKLDNLYDVPKNLATAPPLCLGRNAKVHKYINASSKVIDTREGAEENSSSLLNHPVKPARDGPQSSYLSMHSPPVACHVASGSPHGLLRASDAYDILPSNRTSAASNMSDDVYEVPPTARPVNPDQSATTANMRKSEEVVKIGKSARTRSYVRSSIGEGMTPNNDIVLPSKLGGDNDSSDEMSSEESEDSSVDPEPPLVQKPSKPAFVEGKVVAPHPAARQSRPEPKPRQRLTASPASRVQYVELDESSLAAGNRITANRTQPVQPQSSVQYVEVDLVKTSTAANEQSGNH